MSHQPESRVRLRRLRADDHCDLRSDDQPKWNYLANLQVQLENGLCLDAKDLNANPGGGEVITYSCHSNAPPQQRWNVRARNGGHEIFVRHSNGRELCLHVSNGSGARYAPCDGSNAQIWVGDHGPNRSYLSVGDSYSSGVAAGNYVDTTCYNSWNGYPVLVAQQQGDLRQGVACSGATTAAGYYNEQPLKNRRPQYQYFTQKIGDGSAVDALNWNLVTVTIGGNDIGFAEYMLCTFLSNNCAHLEAAAEAAINSLSLDALYRDMAARAPNAKIRILTYPYLYPPGTNYGCNATLTAGEVQAMNRLADLMNARIISHVNAARETHGGRVQVVDVRDRFRAHGACANDPWVTGVVPIPNLNESFHANAAGHQEMARQVLSSL